MQVIREAILRGLTRKQRRAVVLRQLSKAISLKSRQTILYHRKCQSARAVLAQRRMVLGILRVSPAMVSDTPPSHVQVPSSPEQDQDQLASA